MFINDWEYWNVGNSWMTLSILKECFSELTLLFLLCPYTTVKSLGPWFTHGSNLHFIILFPASYLAWIMLKLFSDLIS